MQIMLPDGTNYSTQVGSLSLGAPGTGIQPLGTDISNSAFGDINGQTYPGSLAAQNVTPSNSFRLHYGSASLDQMGSLVWGAYDQSRVLGRPAQAQCELQRSPTCRHQPSCAVPLCVARHVRCHRPKPFSYAATEHRIVHVEHCGSTVLKLPQVSVLSRICIPEIGSR